MLNQKTVVRSGAKVALVLLGMFLLFGFTASYEGRRTSSSMYPILSFSFIAGCALIYFGCRHKRDDDSEEVLDATLMHRFVNLYVDSIIGVNIIITIISLYPNFYIKYVKSLGNFWFPIILSIIFLTCYYFIFESIFQRTFSKFLTGTKVVTEDLSRPNPLYIALRSLLRLVPFEPFSIFTEKGLWHDDWSKTYVVYS